MRQQNHFRILNLSIDLDTNTTFSLGRCKDSLKKKINQVLGQSRNRYGCPAQLKYSFEDSSSRIQPSPFLAYKKLQKSLQKKKQPPINILGFLPDESSKVILHFTEKAEERLHSGRDSSMAQNKRRLRNTIDVFHKNNKTIQHQVQELGVFHNAFSIRTAVASKRIPQEIDEKKRCSYTFTQRRERKNKQRPQNTIIRPWSTRKNLDPKQLAIFQPKFPQITF